MDTPPVVLIDCNNLCYRAFYSQGHLAHGGQATGVVFGFMRAVKDIEARYPLCRPVFCWDYGKGLREQEFSWYKETRRKKRKLEMRDPKKKRMWKEFQGQVDKLRDEYLRRVGYRNVWKADGFEADDLIAQAVEDLTDPIPEKINIVIVSSDEDLYQLLRKGVTIYQPREKRVVTAKSFTNEYGLPPVLWPRVKAIAGCKGDDVPGVRGIGEKKAAIFVSGADGLNKADEKKCYDFEKSKEYKRNMRLVKLPFAGCPDFPGLKKDKYDINGWNDLMTQIGAASMFQKTTPWGGSEAVF